jgi:hypothetical protein
MCFEICFVCEKPIKKFCISIPRTNAYPNLQELHIINNHYKCEELVQKQIKLKNQLLEIEWLIFSEKMT